MAGGTARGERRSEELVAAAALVLREQGWDALTHRALAARAGAPLASTTYYFRNREDLLQRAAERLADEHVEDAHAVAAALGPRPSVPALAGALVAVATGPDETVGGAARVAERFPQAVAHPALVPGLQRWEAGLAAAVGEILSAGGLPSRPTTARRVLALTEGVVLAAVATGEEDGLERARTELGSVLRLARRDGALTL